MLACATIKVEKAEKDQFSSPKYPLKSRWNNFPARKRVPSLFAFLPLRKKGNYKATKKGATMTCATSFVLCTFRNAKIRSATLFFFQSFPPATTTAPRRSPRRPCLGAASTTAPRCQRSSLRGTTTRRRRSTQTSRLTRPACTSWPPCTWSAPSSAASSSPSSSIPYPGQFRLLLLT